MAYCRAVFFNLFAAAELSAYICVFRGTPCNEPILSVINQTGRIGNFGLFRWNPCSRSRNPAWKTPYSV